MKLYYLFPKSENDQRLLDYDVYIGFVIRASRPSAARKAAANTAGSFWGPLWLDPKMTTCKEVTVDGPAAVIMSSLRAG